MTPAAAFNIHRTAYGPNYTQGRFFFGDSSYYSLERPWLDNHPQTSCIPEGSYDCVLQPSPRFHRPMPHLLDVPDRTGILIHPGNTASDSAGCILIGTISSPGAVYNSQKAFGEFMSWLSSNLELGPVTCTITSDKPEGYA